MRNWLSRSPWRRSACAILLSLLATPVLAAPAPGQPATGPADKERSGRLAEMKEIAQKIAVYAVDGTNRVPAKRVSEAVLRMTDPSRERLDGTVWLWCADGRPAAILQLWAQSDDPGKWFLSPSSLSTGLVAADGEDGWRWTPQRPGMKFEPLPSASAPAETAPARLRQMKEFARRFAAHEFWDPDNQRTELRLLGQPIHRYVEPKGEVFDGAVFAFCHDTDPEVILLIEAVRQGPDKRVWRFGAGPLGSAELHLELDRRDVWQMPRAGGGPTEPYWLFHVPMRKSQLNNFSPVGTWVFEKNQFVFNDDGEFRREVIGRNPQKYFWKGQWRREGDTIHTRYTESKTDVGQEVVFELFQEDLMRAPGWGVFQRAKQGAMPGK